MPYNELPLLPPKENIVTESILRKTIPAGRALFSCGKALPAGIAYIDSGLL